MRENLDIIKWWVIIGLASLTFYKLGKVAVNVWGAPTPIVNLFN